MFNKRSLLRFGLTLALASVALISSPPLARAANPPYLVTLTDSNLVAASTTVTLGTNALKGYWFALPHKPTTVFSIGVTVVGTNASTAAQTFTFCPSLSGNKIDKTHTTVFSVAMTGTTENTVTTNFTASAFGGCGYLVLYQDQNAHTASCWTTVKVRWQED